jgi:hypothetical protein
VNLGGPEVAGFRADKGNRPDSRSATAAKPVDVSAVGDAVPDDIYRTERFRVVGYTHTATGLAPGAEHTVRLHFAETWRWRSSPAEGSGVSPAMPPRGTAGHEFR